MKSAPILPNLKLRSAGEALLPMYRYQKMHLKKIDPYFNNPAVEKFKAEYQKRFKLNRCYLDNYQVNKLLEISIDYPEFVENIPLIVEKFSKIKFSNGIGKPTLKWLINEGNWAGILNGERDQFIEDESAENAESDGVKEKWTL